MATTTIQITRQTLGSLKKYKDRFGAETYNEAINQLMKRSQEKKSFYGILGKGTMKEILRGLRDEDDRQLPS